MKKIFLMSGLLTFATLTNASGASNRCTHTSIPMEAPSAATHTIEITGISFCNADNEGNIIDDYGSTLYASEVKFLKPLITYKGLGAYQDKIKLYVKIFSDDEQLKTGNGSPEGYTFTEDLLVMPGNGNTAQLLGWGRNSGGTFSAGIYRFEIWCDGKLLFHQKVRLYSGSTPISESNIIKISDVSWGNGNANGEMVSAYGSALYEGELMYAQARIKCKGLYSTPQSATLYYRIFNSDGNLICGKTSPRGYSSKSTIEIKPGQNVLELSGYGNASGNVYKEGICKVEYWMDGMKIYETSFEVKKKKGSSNSGTKNASTSNTTLANLLSHPMGLAGYNMDSTDPKLVMKAIKSRYEIAKHNSTSFSVWNSNNNMDAIKYGNLDGYYFSYYYSQGKTYNHLIVSYHWHCAQDANVYEEIEKMLADLKTSGIDIECTKVNDEYTKMKGFVKIDDVKYTLEMKQFSSAYEIILEKSIFKNKN